MNEKKYPEKRQLPDISVVISQIVEGASKIRNTEETISKFKKAILIPYKPLSEINLAEQSVIEELKNKLQVDSLEVSEIDDERFTYNLLLNKNNMIAQGKENDLLLLEEDMLGLQDVFVKAMWEWLNIQDYVEFNDIVLDPEDLILEVDSYHMIGCETKYAGIYFDM